MWVNAWELTFLWSFCEHLALWISNLLNRIFFVRLFPSCLLLQYFIKYVVTSLQYIYDFICQYNVDSRNSIIRVFSCTRSQTATQTHDRKKMMSHVARNFESCVPYPEGNRESRKIVSRNNRVTTAKHIWIVAQLVIVF